MNSDSVNLTVTHLTIRLNNGLDFKPTKEVSQVSRPESRALFMAFKSSSSFDIFENLTFFYSVI